MSTQKSIQDPRSFMAHEEREPSPRKIPYPLDSTSYRILDEIGSGVSAIVYKAECVPINSTLVAIKSIDLDQSRADLDNFRREAKAMSLLSHPNILRAHCSFTVDRRLWVVMPFMSAGSLQSIISSSFPEGFSEPCIATILKETLNALSYLHDQGHLHRDIKAGNILIDSNGSVKLADFGVSASIYESNSSHWSSSSSSMMLTDVAGTPYWMAPEVIHSHTGYSFKADIWSFGITALELSHGRPPLSHLPPSKSLIMKITKRFRFSDYHEKNKREKQKKFSKSFMEMVKSCLDQDPSKRPSAEKLMKHSFFKNNCKNSDFLVKNVLQGLPSVEDRFKESKLKKHGSMSRSSEADEEDDDGEGSSTGERIKHRRISGWNFNEDGFELDPVFPPEREDQTAVKKVRFGGELIIQDKVPESGGHDSSESNLSYPAQVTEETEVSEASEGDETRITEETQVGEASGEASERNETIITEETQVGEEASEGDENRIRVGEASEGDENRITEETQVGEEASEGDENRIRVGEASEVETRSTVDREAMIGGLMFLRQSLDEQRQQVTNLIGLLRGEEGGVMVSREEQLVQMIERMNIDLENEKKKNFELEMELEFLKLQICGASRGDDQPSGSGSGSGGVE